MSIVIAAHACEPAAGNYARATRTWTAVALGNPRIAVSLERAIRRNYSDPRNESYRADEPLQVYGISIHNEPDQWGNRVFADVEYSRNGWRTLQAAHVEDNRLVWQTYMD